MPTSATKRRWRRALVITGYIGVSTLGLVLGWNFGNQLAGPWLGAITAINSALFGAMLMGSAERGLAERALARMAGQTRRDQA